MLEVCDQSKPYNTNLSRMEIFPKVGVAQVPDSVLVRHLGGQQEAHSAAIEILLNSNVPAVRTCVHCERSRERLWASNAGAQACICKTAHGFTKHTVVAKHRHPSPAVLRGKNKKTVVV